MELTRNYPEREAQNGLKQVLVKFSGGIKEPQEVDLGPGTETKDLLRHLGLDENGYQLSKGTSDSVFGKNEVLYSLVSNGDLLFATSNVDAGY